MDAVNKLRALLMGNQESALKNLLKSSTLKKTEPKEEIVATSGPEVFQAVKKENPLLGAIAAVESSGGKNVNHDLDPVSGTQAGGMFGFMPRTAYDSLKRNPELKKKYPDLARAAELDDHRSFTLAFNADPKIARDFAEDHLNFNKQKFSNPEEVIYSWLNGRTGTLRALKQGKNLKDHEYVKKVLSNYQQPSPQIDNTMIDIERKPSVDYAAVDTLNEILKRNK